MRRLIYICLLAGILTSACRAQDASPTPTLVDSDLKVRIASGTGPAITKTKDAIAQPDQVAVNEGTDFDVTFSMRGLRWDIMPGELLDILYERNHQRLNRLAAGLSIYRWDENAQKFAFVKNQTLRKKGFLRDIKEGDYLVFHGVFD